ncbi:MAG: metallo-beta-lactamase family protein [Acidimicrobiales bacterium]|jgi:metallo-beta-lactamase family protein
MAKSTSAPTLTFIGGAQTVTGSKTLLHTAEGRILVDCGLFQGRKKLRLQNWAPFPVAPESIDAVLLTHAHLDHCGYLPRLVSLGFRGPVYCTEGTRKLAEIVLPDSGYLQEEEAAYANRKGYSKHDPALPLYTRSEALNCLQQFETVPFDTNQTVLPDVVAKWQRAGHILGAACVGLHLTTHDTRVMFSGDLGRSTHPLLLPPAPIGPANVVVTESTYGDENHPEGDPEELIAEIVNRTARRGGVVLIPSFAVDRTEIVLWHLNQLIAAGHVPDLPVFVDSPMASRALDVYRAEAHASSPEIRPELHGTDLFADMEVTETRTVEESKKLNNRSGPMIIISASGMATGGRIIHHLANRIRNHNNSVLLVGFQAPGTRGEALRSGVRQLKMFGRYHPVRANVASLPLSAHADQNDLLDWVHTASPSPDVVYVNHGEPEGNAALVDALSNRLGLNAVAPRPGERVSLDHHPKSAE